MRKCSQQLIGYVGTHNQIATADLVKVEPADGSGPYLWTTGDTDLLGYSCRGPAISYKSGVLRHVKGSETSNVELQLDAGDAFRLPNGKKLQTSVLDGEFDDAVVTIDRLYMGEWGDIDLGVASWFSGIVGPSQPSSTGVVLTIESRLSKLNKPIPRRVYQPACPYALYDARCGLAKNPVVGHVVGCTTRTLDIDAASAATSWVLGTVQFVSGILSGIRRQVASQNGSTISFALPLATTASPGDSVILLLGCDKSRARCTQIGNIANFGGFPYVPRPESVR